MTRLMLMAIHMQLLTHHSQTLLFKIAIFKLHTI